MGSRPAAGLPGAGHTPGTLAAARLLRQLFYFRPAAPVGGLSRGGDPERRGLARWPPGTLPQPHRLPPLQCQVRGAPGAGTPACFLPPEPVRALLDLVPQKPWAIHRPWRAGRGAGCGVGGVGGLRAGAGGRLQGRGARGNVDVAAAHLSEAPGAGSSPALAVWPGASHPGPASVESGTAYPGVWDLGSRQVRPWARERLGVGVGGTPGGAAAESPARTTGRGGRDRETGGALAAESTFLQDAPGAPAPQKA